VEGLEGGVCGRAGGVGESWEGGEEGVGSGARGKGAGWDREGVCGNHIAATFSGTMTEGGTHASCLMSGVFSPFE